MKKTWIILAALSASAVFGLLTACGSSGNPPLTNTACINGVCPSVYGNTNGVGTTSTKVTFTAQTSNFAGYGYQQTGNLQVGSGFKLMLKEALGICDRAGTSTGGYAACDAWSSGLNEITFQMDNTNSTGVKLMIRSALAPSYSNYYYSVPSSIKDLFYMSLG